MYDMFARLCMAVSLRIRYISRKNNKKQIQSFNSKIIQLFGNFRDLTNSAFYGQLQASNQGITERLVTQLHKFSESLAEMKTNLQT